MKKTGRLVLLSAPSGSGKTTILQAMLHSVPGVIRSVSATTRPPRVGEKNGRDYRFLSRLQFDRARRRGEFLEYAPILSEWYGTPRRPVERALRAGKTILMGVDVQGACLIRRSRLPMTTIFLIPPSFQALEERLRRRGTETPQQVRARLQLARREMKELKRYDYAVVNDRLADAIQFVKAIVKAEQCRVKN